MFEVILIVGLSLCVLFLSNWILKLQHEVNSYKFEKFMGEVDKELTSCSTQNYVITERILQ
jgi:hypothetical protein